MKIGPKLSKYKMGFVVVGLGVCLVVGVFVYLGRQMWLAQEIITRQEDGLGKSEETIASMSAQIFNLENEDQRKKNKELDEKMKQIESSFRQTLSVWERLADLRAVSIKDAAKYDKEMAAALKWLSEGNYSSAAAKLTSLPPLMERDRVAAMSVGIKIENLVVENKPPESGYRRQRVNVDGAEFVVDVVTASLSNTKVIVDTASENDCGNNCPVMSLSDYVARSGAFAGVNGSYFCPAEYPTCAGKTNSFDTLLMNKNKKYFNSDNNVYSVVPAAIFNGTSARFVSRSLEWGRDTGVDAVIANQPLLVAGGKAAFGGDGDSKHASRGGRSFIGSGGGNVYIGVVRGATVAEAAKVLAAMGLENALNLDDGGSTALWSGGYKAGPGRNIPNAVLLVRR